MAAAAALSVAGRTKSVMVEATPGTLLYLALILVAVLGVPPSFYTAQPEQQEVVKRFGANPDFFRYLDNIDK
ncbi:MAG: hypothetical protein M0Q95_10050 [Porticoccaceae bacterium]|nr:hypothetical protein [Porticoccaceae bacterium]